jgi:ribosomal protein S12 methylthiotransferase accessory factor YcaO
MGIPLDWIFDRLFISLTVATLISKGVLPDAARWRAFIESFELWLAGAPGTLNEIWSGRTIALAVRTWDAEPRPPLDINTALLDPAFVYVRPRE